jgi:predicted DNA binding protein
MANLAVKIAVIESEKGWGRKIDDWMVCLSVEDANLYKKEFNARNVEEQTPDWYMQVEGEPQPIDLTDKQYELLKKEERVWLSVMNSLEKE